MRATLLALGCAASLVGHASSVLADWPPEGVPLCTSCDAGGLLICPDGSGGVYVAWYRFGGDVSLQRVTAEGVIPAGWPAEGVLACVAPEFQGLNSIAPDGFGGVFVAWEDHRSAGSGGPDIYVQRVHGDGTLAPGWAVNGMPATRQIGFQTLPVVLADGLGGAYVTWIDETLLDVYLQRMTPSGEVAPGWPVDGLVVCDDPAEQDSPQLALDDAGGVFVAWGDQRHSQYSVYAQRVLGDGSLAPMWSANGTQILLDRYLFEIMSDGTGGAFLTAATTGPVDIEDFYLQRFTASGAIAQGWPAGGAPVCQAPSSRSGIRMVADGADGTVLAWTDNRDSGFDGEIFLLRMRGDGTRYAGWPLDGLRVTDNTLSEIAPDLAPDGLGGAYLCWDRYLGPSVGSRTAVHHVNGDGTRNLTWPADGHVIPSEVEASGARIAPDGMGGAIVAWLRLQDDGIRALRLGPDGPVAVALSLASAEATVERVRLVWVASHAPGLRVDVERRGESGPWQTLANLSPDGRGHIEYEDRDVSPGERYGYRLAYQDEGTLQHMAETWVTVPKLELTLEGFRPNPTVGEPRVAFVLAESGPATLEVYDVAGRQVASHEVGALGPGRHVVGLEGREWLRAGVYAMRLVQGGRVLQARGVVVR